MKTAIISLLLMCSFSVHAQFAGGYAPALWSEIHVPSCDNGFVQTEFAPGSIIVTGAEAGCNQGDPSFIAYEFTLTSCGTLSFDWNYQTSDCQGPYWDPFGYLLNGIPVQLTLDGSTSGGDNDQSGVVSVPVEVGDVFSFYIFSRDNYCGEAHAAISKFNGPPRMGPTLSMPIPGPVYYGYAPLSCTTLVVDAISGTPPYTYEWSHDENTGDAPNLSTVCATSPACFWVTCLVTDAACNINQIAAKIEVINVICEGTNKIELCHKYNTVCVPYHAVAAHLAHGDQLGACGETADCDTEMIVAEPPQEGPQYQAQSSIHIRASDDGILPLLASEKSDLHSDRVNVFPNPATDKLYLSLTRKPAGSCNVSLVNTNGAVLKSFDVECCQDRPVEIDISMLPVGLYQLWVTLAKGTIITKTVFVQ